jgi:hypothetical protein
VNTIKIKKQKVRKKRNKTGVEIKSNQIKDGTKKIGNKIKDKLKKKE